MKYTERGRIPTFRPSPAPAGQHEARRRGFAVLRGFIDPLVPLVLHLSYRRGAQPRRTQQVVCHLQRYLAQRCIAIWPDFCNAICHPQRIAHSMIRHKP